MNRLKATNSVPFANRDVAPTLGTPQYATNGNPSTPTPATIWPAYAWNMAQDEIMNVILAAGLTPDDTNWAQLLQAIMSLPGKNVQVKTSSGSFTVPASVFVLDVELWGGAGGSGGTSGSATNNCGTTGGGAGYTRGLLAVTPGQVITYVVGTGGAAGLSGGTAPTAGSASTFLTLTAGGGAAGSNGTSSGPAGSAGTGGTASGGTENYSGQPGGTFIFNGGSGGVAAAGGGGTFKFPGVLPGSGEGAGHASSWPGVAGAAAVTSTGVNYNGGQGSSGQIIIRW